MLILREFKVSFCIIFRTQLFLLQAISQNNANDINLIASELARECRHGVKVKDESLSEKVLCFLVVFLIIYHDLYMRKR